MPASSSSSSSSILMGELTTCSAGHDSGGGDLVEGQNTMTHKGPHITYYRRLTCWPNQVLNQVLYLARVTVCGAAFPFLLSPRSPEPDLWFTICSFLCTPQSCAIPVRVWPVLMDLLPFNHGL